MRILQTILKYCELREQNYNSLKYSRYSHTIRGFALHKPVIIFQYALNKKIISPSIRLIILIRFISILRFPPDPLSPQYPVPCFRSWN